MMASLIIIWTLVAVLSIIAIRRGRDTVRAAGRISLNQLRVLVFRMPLALLLAGFLVEILSAEILQGAIGEESGFRGVLIASVAGGLLPGGPFISFPLAVAFYKAGIGAPQMMALLTGWSIWAFHRALNFELPMMGARFLALRVACSFFFPPLAGLACMAAMHLITLTPPH